MQFSYMIPTKICFEPDCVAKHAAELAAYGKKALLVTGKTSAKACGALDDVTNALEQQGVEYRLYDGIENNPSLETAVDAAQMAAAFGAEFVIGIGGGSPLDAAKAVAVLAANPDMAGAELFKSAFTRALPVVAVPTTAGTGSEVTQYSVLVRKDLETKMGFGNAHTVPKCALLDALYTKTLGHYSTVNTAVDAFSHSIEGYLGNRSTVIADCLALEAMSVFGECIGKLADGALDMDVREKLLYASLLGGMVISQVGVTAVHGMGYCYTYYKDIPHGLANGLLMSDYLIYVERFRKDKVQKALRVMGFEDIVSFRRAMTRLVGEPPALTADEVALYTSQSMLQKGSLGNTAGSIAEQDVRDIWAQVSGR